MSQFGAAPHRRLSLLAGTLASGRTAAAPPALPPAEQNYWPRCQKKRGASAGTLVRPSDLPVQGIFRNCNRRCRRRCHPSCSFLPPRRPGGVARAASGVELRPWPCAAVLGVAVSAQCDAIDIADDDGHGTAGAPRPFAAIARRPPVGCRRPLLYFEGFRAGYRWLPGMPFPNSCTSQPQQRGFSLMWSASRLPIGTKIHAGGIRRTTLRGIVNGEVARA